MASKQLEQGEIDALMNELETKMGRLRSVYEQYFMGIERKPPTHLRKDVVRIVHELEGLYVRNTAQKFRIRSLVQRFTSYKTYWNRVERQIEEGTYVRDIRRAERNREKQRERSRDKSADDGVIDIDLEALGDIDFEAEFAKVAEEYEPPAEPAAAPVNREGDDEERERIRKAKLAQISAQLGMGGGAPAAAPEAQETPETAARPSTAATRGAPKSVSKSSPAGGSLSDRRQKLQDIKRRLEERSGKAAAAPAAAPAARPAPAAAAPAAAARPVTRSAPTATSAGTPRPSPPARTAPADDARRVYDQLVEAKRRCNESTQGLSYENVARSMAKQREQLQKSRGASDVEFKVVIKGGRAFLKPETK